MRVNKYVAVIDNWDEAVEKAKENSNSVDELCEYMNLVFQYKEVDENSSIILSGKEVIAND